MKAPVSIVLLTVAMTTQGCSSRPREFVPTLASAPADPAAFEAAYATCRQLLADGKLNERGQLASAGGGAAAGATAAAVGGGAAVAAGGWTGVALASATVVLLPVAALAGAWKIAKTKKNKKERKIKQASAGCLDEQGYEVIAWKPVKRQKAEAGKIDEPSALSKP